MLSREFSEQRFYDSSPHLSVLTKFMAESETEALQTALENEFNNDEQWELEFSDFSLSHEQKYIFLNVTKESRKTLFDVHTRAMNATIGIGSEGMHGATIPKYEYDPHLSIMKLNPEDAVRAINQIKKDFAGLKMHVTRFELTRQKDDEKGYATFPVIAEVQLR